MITASDNFISKVSQTSRRFTARLLYNGAEVACDVKTVKIYKGACGDAFLPGSVYSSYIESIVDNLTANIENKELELQIGLYLADGTVEYVPVGLYTVTKPKISAYQTTFTAVGRIASRLSVIFSPPSEKTIAKITEAITAQTGVNIALKGITASGTIQQNLAGLTCRDVLEIIASILGGFATEDNTGGIVISKFSADVTAEYTCERMLELPTFNEYDYSVSGVKVIVSDASEDEDGGEIEEVSFTSGDPKLIIKNPYMTAELFTAFAANIIGFTYRPGTVPLSLGDPRLEPWDCIRVIDVKGDSMIVPCMNIVHSFDGGLSTTINAPGDSESGADASNKGPATKAIERMAVELLTAEQAIFKRLKADEAELTYAKITMLDAESARIDSIAGDLSSYKEYVGEKFTGLEGDFQELDSVTLKTKDLSAEVAKLGYATIESLNVQTGRIDSLSGEYSEFKTTVTEQFSAVNAEIAETLKTKNLAAEVAKLGYVEADTLNVKIAELGYITADSADLKYAAIGEFDAVKGRVGTLEGSFSSFLSGEFGTLKSGVADIQTLIFGSTTGTTITTEFANAVVAKIGTAQITSGMIKNLAFDKITGFDVNTTNVTVHSQDGKSQWKDNTIQISDANRVRVQIGKDASNDYNMYVWDASGNLMFDAKGLTESGIQRSIIRNDMVAADAAIDGSKLNIQSVVSAIDGSTYTLSSSHLIYDGESLDLFLGDMSETTTEHGNTLSRQGTQIVAIQGQIASKIWQDDIDTAASEMNAKYSNLEQNLNGFKTTVGETYSTKAEAKTIANAASTAQKAADKVKADLATTNANLSTVTSNLSKAQQDILTNAGLIDSQGNLIAGNTALINSQAETISDHETRISQTETDISLKVSSSDFESYKTTVTGAINTAKSEAISAASADATSKADQALANAKNYTKAEIETVNESISEANTEITAMKGQIALKVEQSDIDSAVTTVKTYADGKAADSLTEAKKYTDQRESAINLTLDGITSRVSGVESSQTTINGNVTDLQSRMSTAEEKITPAAIINTVSSTYATKAENQTATDAAEEAKTIAEQTANKFTWIVKSGTSSSDFTLTDRVAQLTAANINLNGLVKFSGLDATTQSKVSSAVSDAASAVETASQAQSTASAASTAASEAKSTANTASTNASNAVTTANAAKTIANTAKSTADTAAADASSALIAANSVDSVIAAWCKDNDRTVIDGAKIYTGSITVDKLYVTDLKTIGATIGGFTIGNSAIYNGATSLAGADNSVYLGLDGISCGTKFKVDKKGVLSTADIKMEKTNTEDGITSTFGTYISSPETWTGSGLAVPEIKTKTETVVDGVTYSDTLTMYPFRISLEKYVTGTDNTWLRLEPTKLSMFSYITTNGFKVPELFIQPAGANSLSSVTLGKEAHQIYSVKWTDDPYDYDDPLASCPHEMYPIDVNASIVTFNSAVAIKNQGLELYHATPYIDFHFGNSDADYTSRIIESASGTLNVQANLQVKGTSVSLSNHTHARLYNGDFNVVLGVEGSYGYFRPPAASKYYNGSSGYPWYDTYTERLHVTKERIVCKPSYDKTTTYAANVYVGSTGIFSRYKSSSSSKYIKHDIKELQDETINAERLYDVDVVQFKYNEGELPKEDQRYMEDMPGFIIENLAESYPIAVDMKGDNSKEWCWNSHYIIPPMLKLIQNQHQVDILHEKQLNKTELRISALQNQLNEAMITIAKQQKQIDLLMAS